MASEFSPSQEGETNDKGEILYEVGELKNVGCSLDDSYRQDAVKQSEILDFGDEGYLLKNLMTEKECQYYINRGEELQFGSLYGAQESYRSQQRITFKNQELSELLWSRIRPFLNNIIIDGDPHKQHIHGVPFLLQGTWEPCSLNDMFRLCRYLPTGHFSPHFDGHYNKNGEERSLKTLMIYLNSDFTGGSTNFVDESQTLYKDESGKYCAEEKNILCRIQPQTGMAINFNHHRLHEGQRIGDGKKYILRTDVMFHNTSKKNISARDEQALLLLQEAERKEGLGDNMEAMDLYRKAFKLSPSLAEAYGS